LLRALALGGQRGHARRPALWGLATGGADGAARVLALLAEELTEAMHLAGCPDVAPAWALRAGPMASTAGVTAR